MISELAPDEVLRVESLSTSIKTKNDVIRAVDHVSFNIKKGEVFGIAGESGSGKSMTAFSLLRLLPPHGSITNGSVDFCGIELTKLQDRKLRDLRGNKLAMIFQDPMSSLNPVLTVGLQISESLRRHRDLDRGAARAEAIKLLETVGIHDAERRFKAYPHEFSGGMRQRVMIAMALSCKPELLIADEPTTALDVTVEKQILDLLQLLRRETGTAILLITHNLALMAEHCDRVAVMYAGQIVEMAAADRLFDNPLHPYTKALLNSVPRGHISDARIDPLMGLPPTITGPRAGCSFAARCAHVMPVCRQQDVPLTEAEPGHFVRCHLFGDGHHA